MSHSASSPCSLRASRRLASNASPVSGSLRGFLLLSLLLWISTTSTALLAADNEVYVPSIPELITNCPPVYLRVKQVNGSGTKWYEYRWQHDACYIRWSTKPLTDEVQKSDHIIAHYEDEFWSYEPMLGSTSGNTFRSQQRHVGVKQLERV